jgi:zinc/manganese transport system substrate-binding protein
MKRHLLVNVLPLVFLLLVSVNLQASLRVFACEPEWSSLANELVGDRAKVYTATTAHQDVHYIQAKPSLIAQVRRADLVICTGADLEVGWLPVLLRRSGNRNVLPGTDGYLEAADYVEMLEAPEKLDRAEGDVHPRGNPHIHLDPRNMLPVAKALSERLIRLDPDNVDTYRERYTSFLERWQNALSAWEQRALPLKGMPIVVHHKFWTYLNHWLGLQQLAALESKPGMPPTTRHLSDILAMMQQTPAKAVIRAPFQDARASQWLHGRTDIVMLELPFTVGGNAESTDLFTLFDSTLALLLKAQQ